MKVGGETSINAMMYVREARKDFEDGAATEMMDGVTLRFYLILKNLKITMEISATTEESKGH